MLCLGIGTNTYISIRYRYRYLHWYRYRYLHRYRYRYAIRLFGASLMLMMMILLIAVTRSLGSHSLTFTCCCSGADDQCRGSGAVCQGGSDLHHRAHPAGVDPHRGQQAPHATGDRDAHARTHVHAHCCITRCPPSARPPPPPPPLPSTRPLSRATLTRFSFSSVTILPPVPSGAPVSLRRGGGDGVWVGGWGLGGGGGGGGGGAVFGERELDSPGRTAQQNMKAL